MVIQQGDGAWKREATSHPMILRFKQELGSESIMVVWASSLNRVDAADGFNEKPEDQEC